MAFGPSIPGPILYDEENHISSQILLGQELDAITFIPTDNKCAGWKLTPKMREYVEMTGLQHLGEMKKCKIDYALLNALIERWRPETNSFHFVYGESTITLEDISYLYGLPIDGKAVTGDVWTDKNKLEATCSRLLGVKVEKSAYLRGGQLSLNWIHEKFLKLPDSITAYDEVRYARAYLFCLVASQICTNNSGARGHAYILELFEEFERYAWGPACLACLYRSMTRATQIKERLRTITGPLQLLQIWAYSHTAVGRHLRPKFDEVCFEFPLFKMWQSVLKDHSFSGTILERRKELGKNVHDQVEWQPYCTFAEQLRAIVSRRDVKIFHTTAPLIYYWIIERHNCDRVFKQFGLIQPVPPPFHRWIRMDERASHNTVDYRSKNHIYVEAWDGRETTIVGGVEAKMKEDQKGVESLHQRVEWALKKVDNHGLDRSIPPVASRIDCFELPTPKCRRPLRYGNAMERKTEDFRLAIKSLDALEEFDLEGFLNNDSNSEKSADSVIPQSIDGPTELCFLKGAEKEHEADSETFPCMKPTVPGARISRSTNERKRKEHDECAAHGYLKKVEKTDQPPLMLSPYRSELRKGDPLPNPEYSLSTEEENLLGKFWDKFHTSPDKLSSTCSYISGKELHQILGMHWISTTVMDYWLAITAGRQQGMHIFPSTLASCRDRGWNQICTEAFQVCGRKRLEEFLTLIFPVWYISHFFLLVAFPNERRWEYYNTMGWRKRHWEYASQFKRFVRTWCESVGWQGLGDWEMQSAVNCPQQSNSNDCGVFIMAIVDHLARGIELRFSQADMWFFRRKIVHDMYKEQLMRHDAKQ